jgi:uncharacterized protein (TIGR03435 family)
MTVCDVGRRFGALIALGTSLFTAVISPQQIASAAQNEAAFEATSVKLNRSGERTWAGRNGGSYVAVNTPLRDLIVAAYGLTFEPSRLVGGLPWINTERFDIVASIPANAPTSNTALMLRGLLADRFKFRVHNEVREIPIYALVRARTDGRLGSRLAPATIDCEASRAAGGGTDVTLREGGSPACGVLASGRLIRAGGQTMANLARMLPQYVGRSVEDRTGLSGAFDFDLDFEPRDPKEFTDVPDPDRPSIFTALREQFGLKLESTRGPVEVVVIDGVERPTEN